jgi:uncharacterized hydrophobic protein (TIGR00341 family)
MGVARMALRLMEIVLPTAEGERLRTVLEEYDDNIVELWQDYLTERLTLFRVVLSVEETEPIIDRLQERFNATEGFRVILLPVAAMVPRPEADEKETAEKSRESTEQKQEAKTSRISREELYAEITERTKLSRIFIVMVILSAIVASVGIVRNNVAVIIGAMVIAPLLGPNVALALATTLGDGGLARRALKTAWAGFVSAFLFSAILGVILGVDPNIPEVASRTVVGLGDVVLALAAGGAATLAFTTGAPSALIGVMVAVALLPPLVTLGMLVGDGYWGEAYGALLLLLVNIISVNLAGVMTFLIQGIRPTNWWEASRARKATQKAIYFWTVLLILLVVMIFLSQHK